MGIKSSDAFPAKYLTAAEIDKNRVRCIVQEVRMESIVEGENEKPVAYFEGKSKGMVLNQTNFRNLAMDFEDDTDAWLGKEVVIFAERKTFKGRPVMGLTIRASGTPAQQRPVFRQPLPNASDPRPLPPLAHPQGPQSLDDDIPF